MATTYRNASELARAVNRDRSTVCKHRRRPDWPIRRDPPWSTSDVKRYKSWLADLQPDRNAAPEDPIARRMGVQLKMEKAAKLREERKILMRMFVARQEVENGLVERARMFRAGLDPLPVELAQQLVGESNPRRIERVIRAAVVAVLEGWQAEYGRRRIE